VAWQEEWIGFLNNAAADDSGSVDLQRSSAIDLHEALIASFSV
jgi:hypothetical protein